VDRGLKQPRYPSFDACLAAQRKEIPRWDASSLELKDLSPVIQQLGIAPPRPRPKKIFTPDTNLSAADRMKQMMSGGLTQKKPGSSLIEDPPDKAVSQAVQFILKEKIVSQQ
jgi:electron transfer flavoprotein alpha/beta subunit|tara:strand:- start:244 stop:579 length:336 start_codon:yes stop_codon:yes gene_type:complete